MNARRPNHLTRNAFTLVESLVALAIAGMAASVLLLTVQSTIATSTDAVDRTIAEGMAQQLMDEILQKRYKAAGAHPRDTFLNANATELAAAGRSGRDDVDDFNDWSATPAASVYGFELGTEGTGSTQRTSNFRVPSGTFGRWRQRVDVYYVNATTQTRLTSGTSYYRCIEINIDQKDADGQWIPLATKKQVIAYVPML